MNTWKDNLKKVWNEHPLETIAVAALAATAAAKLIDSMSSARSKSAYASATRHRVNNTY